MQCITVLVVEDEAAIADLIRVNLHHAGFSVRLAGSVSVALDAVKAALPDIALVDWMLPEGSGLQLVQRWREAESTRQLPIIMLSAKGEEKDKITGLEAGADDYINKPFSPRELLARIHAVLRRRLPEKSHQTLEVKGLQLEPSTHSVTYQGQSLSLGPTEFRLLYYLMAYPSRVHSREHLLDRVWGSARCIEERTVDVHIKRLRKALGEAAVLIQTVYGVGYKLHDCLRVPKP